MLSNSIVVNLSPLLIPLIFISISGGSGQIFLAARDNDAAAGVKSLGPVYEGGGGGTGDKMGMTKGGEEEAADEQVRGPKSRLEGEVLGYSMNDQKPDEKESVDELDKKSRVKRCKFCLLYTSPSPRD